MVRLGTPPGAVVPPRHHRSPSGQVGLLGACCHRPRAYSLDVAPGREWTRAPRCFKAHVSLNCPLSVPSGHVACVCARSPRRDHNAPPQRSFERHEQQRELSARSAPYEFREVLDQICSLSGKPAPRCSRARTAHGPAPPTGLSSMSTCKSDARYSCEHREKTVLVLFEAMSTLIYYTRLPDQMTTDALVLTTCARRNRRVSEGLLGPSLSLAVFRSLEGAEIRHGEHRQEHPVDVDLMRNPPTTETEMR